ncbi:hypothetical protein ONS95_012168 [Cadophora gregata]|uniref:uncharacterized protein n=1 Tax=Cadophora gregata TaxID=51156 RepID=UPI0026DD18CD|nr:uncharacterized protein ONS95_012168 [Cadophora gregata]KAK0117846.1 hypothetical protein ONS95_012168 [Cadophora gregata]KAK0122901.1 hypothetical protein ONS96_009926 [Cadophora gregata f. sp. sojae]
MAIRCFSHASLMDMQNVSYEYHDIMVKLFDYGLAVEDIRSGSAASAGSPFCATSFIQSTMKRLTLEQKLGTLEVSDTIHAILCQDENAFQKAIERFSDQINQQDNQGMVSLHLSATWPEGILILLNGGADLNVWSSTGYKPLLYTCISQNFSSKSILLDHDSLLGGPWEPNLCLEEVSRGRIAP